eukprot:746756-Hanusia_phi.AAC.7
MGKGFTFYWDEVAEHKIDWTYCYDKDSAEDEQQESSTSSGIARNVSQGEISNVVKLRLTRCVAVQKQFSSSVPSQRSNQLTSCKPYDCVSQP